MLVSYKGKIVVIQWRDYIMFRLDGGENYYQGVMRVMVEYQSGRVQESFSVWESVVYFIFIYRKEER